MATNPMQRKSRLSFILGMVVMLLICAIFIGILFWQLTNYQKKEKAEQAALVTVYTLNQDVSSGQVITPDMYNNELKVNMNTVPSNATTDISMLQNYALQDKEGNEVITKYENDSNNKKVAKLYLSKKSGDVELNKEENSENYYIEENGEKKYVELNNVPLIAKVEMKKNTVLTTALLAKGDSTLADDVRKEEFNTFVLPMDLKTGDYVDVRLMLPSGQNYIVVAKKEVEIPSVDGVDVADTIWMNISEDEILSVSSAIVDAYRIPGSKLYVDKYTEAGMQKAATPTYVVTAETAALLNKDPNILEKAKKALIDRYNAIDSANIRNEYIQKAVDDAAEDAEGVLEQKIEESTQKSLEARQEYLESLAGTVTETTSSTTNTTNTTNTTTGTTN